jgi:hypothetical protein
MENDDKDNDGNDGSNGGGSGDYNDIYVTVWMAVAPADSGFERNC